MPLHIETELEATKAKVRTQLAVVAGRQAFIDSISASSDEALKLHNAALVNDKRILAEYQSIVETQQKAVDDANAAAEASAKEAAAKVTVAPVAPAMAMPATPVKPS